MLIAFLGLISFTLSLLYLDSMPICATAPLTSGSCEFLLATFWAGVAMIAVAFAYSVVSAVTQLREVLRLTKARKLARADRKQKE